MASKPFKLTDEQIKAIDHHKGHLQILACAGSGKTEVISARIARMICEKHIQPKTIVAFTFTNKAADELKARIRKKVDELQSAKVAPEVADLGDMFVGTIDSFCFYMLKELAPEYKSFDILQEASRIAFISRFYYGLGLKKLESPAAGRYTVTTTFASDIDLVRREGLDLATLKNQDFAACAKKYVELLRKERFLDFEGVIGTLLSEMKNETHMRELHSKVKHLVVDEYQDVNRSQETLIEIMSVGCDSVCVVGDDDQCIYYWRGSESKNIVDFQEKYSKNYDVTTLPLLINYRSTDAIVHTARSFIGMNRSRIKKEMQHWAETFKKHNRGDIFQFHFPNEETEFGFLVQHINALNGSDYVDGDGKKFALGMRDVAILVRTNAEAARLKEFLAQQNIPTVSDEGDSAITSPESVLALKAIAYVGGFQYFRYVRFARTTRIDITVDDLCKEYSQVFPKADYPEANEKYFRTAVEKIKKKIDITKKKEKDYLSDKFTFQNIFHLILNAMGAERFDFNRAGYDVLMFNLSVLSQAISDFESVYRRLRVKELSGFLHFIATYGEMNYREANGDAGIVDAVRIMTVHKAKGLQFPAVFLPCRITTSGHGSTHSFVDQTEYDAQKYEGGDEEERRVWYVAMTRAEKYLFITGSELRIGYKNKTKPHRFVTDLDRKYISSSDAPKLTRSGLNPRVAHYQELYATSFSDISSYKRCPYDFKFRHEFGLNAGVPVTFGYGTNVHNVLNIIYKKFKDRPPTKEEVERLVEQNFYFRYATDEIKKNMVKAGKKVIQRYVDLFSTDFKNVLETEKRFEFVMGDASISGQIDLIKKMNDANEVVGIEIIDFKTDKDGPYERDYQTQLRLYAIACMEALGLNPKKASIHHLDKKTKAEIEDSVDISKPRLDETKKELNKQVSLILEAKFPAKPKDDTCKMCDYRFVCSKKTCIAKLPV